MEGQQHLSGASGDLVAADRRGIHGREVIDEIIGQRSFHVIFCYGVAVRILAYHVRGARIIAVELVLAAHGDDGETLFRRDLVGLRGLDPEADGKARQVGGRIRDKGVGRPDCHGRRMRPGGDGQAVQPFQGVGLPGKRREGGDPGVGKSRRHIIPGQCSDGGPAVQAVDGPEARCVQG